MKNRVLLVGNDINNATSDYSWENLLTDLIDYAKLEDVQSSENKPFPLFYEEIFLNSARRYGTQESRLKKYIAAKSRRLIPNIIHQEILKLGVKDIMTTNYDLTLEEVIVADSKKIKNSGFIKESTYNLFRVNKINDINFWHIHGSESAPQSITLGYEHYGGYLQQMRNYVVTGTKNNYSNKSFLPITMRLQQNDIQYESWVDFFFTKDIDIFGLNFDFVEMHLWWLLTYRARIKVLQKSEINNRIRYYYPKKYEKQSKHKLELFKANEVETVGIEMKGDNRINYYKKVIEHIKGNG